MPAPEQAPQEDSRQFSLSKTTEERQKAADDAVKNLAARKRAEAKSRLIEFPVSNEIASETATGEIVVDPIEDKAKHLVNSSGGVAVGPGIPFPIPGEKYLGKKGKSGGPGKEGWSKKKKAVAIFLGAVTGVGVFFGLVKDKLNSWFDMGNAPYNPPPIKSGETVPSPSSSESEEPSEEPSESQSPENSAIVSPSTEPSVEPSATPTETVSPSPSPSESEAKYAEYWIKTPEEEADLAARMADCSNKSGLFTEKKKARNNFWDSKSYQKASTEEFVNGLSPTKLGILEAVFQENGECWVSFQFDLLDFVVRDGDVCCLVNYEDVDLNEHKTLLTFPKEATRGWVVSQLSEKRIGSLWNSNHLKLSEFVDILEGEKNEAIMCIIGLGHSSEDTKDYARKNFPEDIPLIDRLDQDESSDSKLGLLNNVWITSEFRNKRSDFLKKVDGVTDGNILEFSSLEEYKQAVISGKSGIICNGVSIFDSQILES